MAVTSHPQGAVEAGGRVAAIFDLDNTLTEQDTLVPWLIALAGRQRFALTVTRAVALYGVPSRKLKADTRTRFKHRIQAPLLAGIAVERAEAAAAALAPQIAWKESVLGKLKDHLACGARVLVATGAAEMAARPLLASKLSQPIEVIGTPMEVHAGVLTGAMVKNANCVREEKARRVRAWLEAEGPFSDTYGYGNAPHDLAMLDLLNHREII